MTLMFPRRALSGIFSAAETEQRGQPDDSSSVLGEYKNTAIADLRSGNWPPGPTDADSSSVPSERERAAPIEVFSVAEVARFFGRTERTIRNWVRTGRLRRSGIGRSVFFTRAAVEALLRGEPAAPEVPQ